MTVACEQAHIAYIANGKQTRFPLPFTVSCVQALQIAWADENKRDVFYQPGSDYSIAGSDILFSQPPPEGRRLTVARADPLVQTASFSENDRFYAHTIEASFDRLTGQIQRVYDLAERCPTLPLSSGVRQVTLQPPSSGAVLRWGSDGKTIISDDRFATNLLEARDQALEAQTSAATAAALAQKASFLAPAAIAAAEQALQAAAQAQTTLAIVQSAAERASWALGLMGLANNLTQLLFVVAPFLTRLFGLWKDFGWIDQSVQISIDFGWACGASAERCRDFGLIVDRVARDWDLTLDSRTQDWGAIDDPVECHAGLRATGNCIDFGLIAQKQNRRQDWVLEGQAQDFGLTADIAPCFRPPDPVCLDDLGWINAVLPLNSQQPITLPIRVPDPCPVIFAEPSTPPPPTSGAFKC